MRAGVRSQHTDDPPAARRPLTVHRSCRNDADPGGLAGAGLLPNHDLNVLVERGKQVHQALDGEARQLVVAKSGDLRLRHSQHPGSFGLSELPPVEQLVQGVGKAELRLTFRGVAEARDRRTGSRVPCTTFSFTLVAFEELFGRYPDVLRNLPQQRGRDVASAVERNGRASTIRVAELFVRAFLPNLDEAQTLEKGDDLTRFQRGQRAHLRDPDGLDRHELGLEFRLPILEEHATTSCRFACSSSSDSPWLCAPGQPGTWPTNRPVSGSRSMTTLKVRMPQE